MSRRQNKNPRIAADVKVLLTGTIPGHTEPVAWTRNYNGGRVFYTVPADRDFELTWKPSASVSVVNGTGKVTAR